VWQNKQRPVGQGVLGLIGILGKESKAAFLDSIGPGGPMLNGIEHIDQNRKTVQGKKLKVNWVPTIEASG
jgi:hypothetical protein